MADNPRIYDSKADLNNLWTVRYDSSNSQGGRDLPTSWRGDRAHAVGLTAPNFSVRGVEGGPWVGDFNEGRVDPQVVFRYRPNDDMSFYARYAQAYKGGGFDTGQTTLPETEAAWSFGSEYSRSYEGGVKGTTLNSRLRYDFNLFDIKIKDLQQETSVAGETSGGTVQLNIGGQRVRGLEWSTVYIFSEQLLGSISGALLDGVMTDFPDAPCTQTEAENPASSGCTLYEPGNPDAGGTLNRSGDSAPNTPDWKFIGDLDYWLPMPGFPEHKLSLNTKAYISAGYCDSIGDCGTTRWGTHWDANVSIGIGDMDGDWEVTAFIKNLNHPTITRHQEELENPDFGIDIPSLRPSNFTNYGLRLRYNFF
jgi:outer membrane receptor protein involved in Fe transport